MKRLVITSRQNQLVKTVCGLAEKKKRTESGLFRADGVKLLQEALNADMDIRYVVCREDTESCISPIAERAGADTLAVVSEAVFDKISEEKAPEGVVTVCAMPQALHARAEAETCARLIQNGEKILLAESLRDPGNLGTVMRSCFALGIDRLILTSDCAELYNPRTLRAAMGAIFRLPTLTVSDSLTELISALRKNGRRVFATALHTEAKTLGELRIREGDCFVIGNEGHGLSEETVEACTGAAVIPMREGAESLNAAAAAAICIWETVRADKSGEVR